mgnify:CR=1 FL=1
MWPMRAKPPWQLKLMTWRRSRCRQKSSCANRDGCRRRRRCGGRLAQAALSVFLMAVIIGVPVGVAVGLYASVREISHVPFQFLRMISPLAWMPIAVQAPNEIASGHLGCRADSVMTRRLKLK